MPSKVGTLGGEEKMVDKTPPPYLLSLVRDGGGTTVHRRCVRHLPEIWKGLTEYVGRPLDSRCAWDDHIRPYILQRWYVHWCNGAEGSQATPQRQRWLRYTLNRLAGTAGFHVQHCARRVPQTKMVYVGLRCSHQQEDVVDAVLPVVGADNNDRPRYCLRRFLVGYPLWDVEGLRAVTEEDVRWWLRERRPAVVLDTAGVVRFEADLWACLRRVVPSLTDSTTAAACRRRTSPLLYDQRADGVDPARIPDHVMLFFRPGKVLMSVLGSSPNTPRANPENSRTLLRFGTHPASATTSCTTRCSTSG